MSEALKSLKVWTEPEGIPKSKERKLAAYINIRFKVLTETGSSPKNVFGSLECMLFGKTRDSKKLLKVLLPFFVILIVSLWSLSDVLKSPGTALVNAGDDILITWIINENIQKIPYHIKDFFQGNIFYPYKNTKAYSELFLPSSIISYIPVKLTGLPIFGYNSNLMVGQIATIVVVYLWFFDITKDKWASLLGAIVLGVSQIRIHYYAHLQMWNMQWWLLASWLVWKYSKKAEFKYLYLAGILVAIQFWESPLPVYFAAAISCIILAPKLESLKKRLKHILSITLIILVLISPAIIAYYKVSNEFNYVRPIREVAHFSLSVNDLWGMFLAPGLYSLFFISLFIADLEKTAGYQPADELNSDMSFSFRRNRGLRSAENVIIYKDVKKKRKDLIWLFAIFAFGILMSFGPVLKWQGATVKIFDNYFFPLPYGVFYYLIPGFKALRTPLQWLWVSAFAASGIIAVSFSSLRKRFKYLYILVGITIALLGGRQVPVVAIAPTPDRYQRVYTFLQDQPGNVVLELPIYTWGQGEVYKHEFWRLLYSLKHKKKLINGTSGFTPPERLILAARLEKEFPSEELEKILVDLGVDYVLVHKHEFSQVKLREVRNWGKDKLIWEDEDAAIYKI